MILKKILAFIGLVLLYALDFYFQLKEMFLEWVCDILD